MSMVCAGDEVVAAKRNAEGKVTGAKVISRLFHAKSAAEEFAALAKKGGEDAYVREKLVSSHLVIQ